jgi:hypothetical protein
MLERGLVDVFDVESGGDVFLQAGHHIAARKAGRSFPDLVKTFFEVGHLGLAHRLLKLALEFRGHFAGLAHPLSDRAQHAWQFLGPDGNERDNRDDGEFTPRNVKHERFPTMPAITKSQPLAPFSQPVSPLALARSRRRQRF